jgi:hypothetical protein
MSKNDTEMQEALDLDQRWDELNADHPAVRRLDRGDQELRELVALDASAPPRPEFVAGLMTQLRAEARQLESIEPPAASEPITVLEPVRPVRRMRGLSGAGKVASVLLAASLLFGMMAALVRYPFTSTDGTGGPTVVAPGPQIPDVPMPGANPARTNVQPGPGLTMLPEIKQKADVVGTSMALADNVLVVVGYTTVSAFDVNTLTELWAVKLKAGAYSEPSIADGTIYFGYTANTESASTSPDNNQLVAISLANGQVKWRVDGAGFVPVNPLVSRDIVYALGVAKNRYQLGAYRAANGTTIWQTDLGPATWCCPVSGLALSGDRLAATTLYNVGVFNAADGHVLWQDATAVIGYAGTPVIVGNQVIVSTAKDPDSDASGQPISPGVGQTVAYDLDTGRVRWTNDSTRSHGSEIAASTGVLYAGAWLDSVTGRFGFMSLESGVTVWSQPLPEMEDMSQTFVMTLGPAQPVIVGESAYILSSTPPTPNGAIRSSSFRKIELEDGTSQWSMQIDGGVTAMPIVSGGRIYVLTLDSGLYVIGDSAAPVATPGSDIDLRTPPTCNATPSDSPMLGDLPATPTILQVAPWNQPIPFAQLPSGDASGVDSRLAEHLNDLFTEYRACSAVDPYHGVFGFFSTDFYVRLKTVQEYWGEPDQPWAVWMAPMQEYLTLETGSLVRLPDGRIGGTINSPTTNIYVWFVQEDGEWMIDEYHRIWPDQTTPTTGTPAPSTNPEGTPLG